MVKKSEVQGTVNGPVWFSNFQRIKHHVQDTDYYSARCSATMSSSDCTERRKQQLAYLYEPIRRLDDSYIHRLIFCVCLHKCHELKHKQLTYNG